MLMNESMLGNQSSQMWWAERRRVGAPTIFQMHVEFGINLVGESPSKWALLT